MPGWMRTLAWLNIAVAFKRISNRRTATAGAPSSTMAANLINMESAISMG